MAEQHSGQSIVDQVKMPKLKIDNKKLAGINAFTTAFATFFGFTAIMAAISSFTKGDWSFNVPFVGTFLGSNLGQVSTVLVVALLALVCAIIGLMTVRKITNLEAMKKSWHCVSKVFLVFAAIFCVNLIGVMLYSLLSLGRKSTEVSQATLWGSNFVANLILMAASCAMYFVSTKIAHGETKYLSVLRFVAIAVAVVAVVIVVVSLLVGFYAKGSSSSYDSMNDVYDYFRSWSY
ncbi:hypothetical protein IJ102_02085 [Candidatus Saccharibacteria bacterium]|nr:hypothetical protein [Candidatus Saccharibacteria bacterium]